MRRALVTAAALALAAVPAATAAVEVKSVDATRYPEVAVTAATSTPVDRAPVIWEGGLRAAAQRAENLGRTKSIVLAIDRSKSMEGTAFADAVAAARSFVARKRAGDRISIVGFGSKAVQLSRFSSATIDADIALRTLAVDDVQGTALNDAIALSSRALGAEALASRVLIVLTDGSDVGSTTRAAAATAAAREAGVVVFAVGIESQQFSPRPLERLAEVTGGTYHGTGSTAQLASAYAAIGTELKRTWRVRYLARARPGEEVQVGVRAGAAGTGAAKVRMPGEPAGGTDEDSAGLVPEEAYGSWWGSLVVGLLVGTLVLLAGALAARAREGNWVRTRLAAHVNQQARVRKAEERERFAAGSALFKVTERAFGHLKLWQKVARLLERADLPLRTVEFFYIVLGAAFLFALFAAVAGQSSLVILACMGAGGAAPFGYVSFKGKKRLKAFENQLPDVLLTIAASLKAGHSFKQGLQVVVDEGAEPAAKEFNRVLTETRLGRPMDDALNELDELVGSKNLEFVITAVIIQSQVGGSLAGLFDMVADAVRQRQQFARKIKGLTAMGRASAYVLIGIPFFIAGSITLLNGEYMEPLYHTSTGHFLIGLGLTMMTMGSLILKRMVSFKG